MYKTKNNIERLLAGIDQEHQPAILRAIKRLEEMDEQGLQDMAALFFCLVQEEVRAGLGMSGADEDDLDQYGDLAIFEMIDAIYQQSAQGCYFCDSAIDANETEVDHDTRVCADCQLKLANFLRFVGADPARVLALGPPPRRVQHTRFDPGQNKIRF